MIEKVSEEVPEENSTHKEVIRTIASGINSLKTQLVNVTNRNKRMWRAVARSGSETVASSLSHEQLEDESSGTPGRYNLRMTPTRQAAASRYQKQTAKGVANEQQEGRSSSNEDDVNDNITACSLLKTDKSEETETGGLTEPTCMDGKEMIDSKSLELVELSVTEDAAVVTMEPSASEHTAAVITQPSTAELTATVKVPVTELERAKQMAQQLTALIANLESQESGFTVTSSECV